MKTMHELKTMVADAFNASRVTGYTSMQEVALLNHGVRAELNRKSPSGKRWYTQYMAGYVQGLIDLQRDLNYQHHLEFCYVDADGTRYSTRKGTKLRSTEEWYASGRGAELGKLPGGHYWIESGKPYHISESVIK